MGAVIQGQTKEHHLLLSHQPPPLLLTHSSPAARPASPTTSPTCTGSDTPRVKMGEPKSIPLGIKLLFGGSAGIGATLHVQPLDLVKTRMQVAKSSVGTKISTLGVISGVIKSEGILTMYTGLSAALLRQATYTTSRLGIYTWLFEKFSTDGKAPGFFMKAAMGMAAGGSAAFVGTPAEVALIRMTSDGSLPVDKRRNYSSVFNALARIYKEEGLATLWRGATPTMARAMVVNGAQLATYSQAKQIILDSGYIKDGIFCHFVAAMISGLVTTIASMPVDIVKTRLQNQKFVNGVPEYKRVVDVFGRLVKNE